MKQLQLNLDAIFGDRNHSTPHSTNFLVAIGNMRNAQYAVDVVGKRLIAVTVRDSKLRNAVSTLQQAKLLMRTHGASECLMSIFNEGNQLGKALKLTIPAITAINADSVGVACCEAIDDTVKEAYGRVKAFFEELQASVLAFFEKLEETACCQRETLEVIAKEQLASIETIDAEAFAKEDVFGYAQVAFMQRVAALNNILDGMVDCDYTKGCLAGFTESLNVLGYKVSTEEAEIVEETPAEAAADAPAPETILNPDPVADEPAATPEPAAEPAPAADPVAAEPDATASTEEADQPADVAQEQNMAVFGWNPGTIRDAVKAMIELLSKTSNLNGVKAKFEELKASTIAAIDEVSAAEGDMPEKAAQIEEGREVAGFIGNLVALYQSNVSELVDQLVTLCAKLKNVEVPPANEDAVPVEEVTVEQPLGPETPSAMLLRLRAEGDIVEPAAVPGAEPEEPKVDPVTEPQPTGDAEHVEPVATPEGDQPEENLPGEPASARFWQF